MKNKLLTGILIAGILYSQGAYAQTTIYGITDASQIFATDSTGSPASVATVANTGNDLLVYPNPVYSSTRIILPNVSAGTVYVNVIDLSGRVDRSYQYVQGTYQADVDMSNLPTGLYSVRVTGDGIGYHNLKIVKE